MVLISIFILTIFTIFSYKNKTIIIKIEYYLSYNVIIINNGI
jgi:hypothetical protein